jgi:hypothetical protein
MCSRDNLVPQVSADFQIVPPQQSLSSSQLILPLNVTPTAGKYVANTGNPTRVHRAFPPNDLILSDSSHQLQKGENYYA